MELRPSLELPIFIAIIAKCVTVPKIAAVIAWRSHLLLWYSWMSEGGAACDFDGQTS